MYVILLVLGLGIGAVFLVVLLIGDRKEARLEAQRKAAQEQRVQASQPVEGAWPPPPSVSASPVFSPYAAPAKPAVTRAANRKMVRNFFLVRNYAIATVILAYILYSCFPRFRFEWVLAATALAAAVLWGVLTLRGRLRRRL